MLHWRSRSRGHNSQASAPDGRPHLIPRSVRNTPPQQTVSKEYIPGVNTPSTQQALLSRRMAETNLTMSCVTRSRYQLSIDSIPRPAGTREDGTFTGLDGDGTHVPWYLSVFNPIQLSVNRRLLLPPVTPQERIMQILLSCTKIRTDSEVHPIC